MQSPHRRSFRRPLVALALALAPTVAVGAAPASADGGCAGFVEQAQTWVATPDQYMPQPRPGDTGKGEPSVVYAEVDHFETQTQTDGSGMVIAQEQVPVYKAMSLGGILLKMAHTAPDDGTATQAEQAIVDAWANWANGDATKPVPYDAAQQILADAAQRCQAAPNTA